MKLFSTLAVAVAASLFCVEGAKAETLNPASSELSTAYNFATSSSSSSSSSSKLKSGLELDYLMVEEQTAFGASLVLGGLVFNGTYGSLTELPNSIDKQVSWSAGVGLNKRIYIFNALYIEGRAGAAYSESITEYTSSSDPKKYGSWGGFANARAGLKLLDNTCVNVGYKWNFEEFNFSNEYTSTYMTLGLTFLF